MSETMYDRAVDVAVLRELLRAKGWITGPVLVKGVVAFTRWDMMALCSDEDEAACERQAVIASINQVMRHLLADGWAEKKPDRWGHVMWRLRADTPVLRITGGLDPANMTRAEVMELNLPHVVAARHVKFEPRGYMKVQASRRAHRALWQCPSPWALAERIMDICATELAHKKGRSNVGTA